jgi:hypothetical protein
MKTDLSTIDSLALATVYGGTPTGNTRNFRKGKKHEPKRPKSAGYGNPRTPHWAASTGSDHYMRARYDGNMDGKVSAEEIKAGGATNG